MSLRGMLRPGMRSYLFPLAAGLTLAASAFRPWVHINEVALTGMSEAVALWVVALGILAALLAVLSLITRKNSRHPLLVLGLVALAIMFLSWRLLPRMAAERALTHSQAVAIVEGLPTTQSVAAHPGAGIYVGLAASVVIVLFGLTIVVKRAQTAYALPPTDDDVD
jgi:hypothetical protein